MAYSTLQLQQKKHGSHVEFISGWVAGCLETVILYPKNKLIFRQQLHGVHALEAVSQLKTEGIRYLYRGLLPPLLKRSTSRSIMFGMYEKYQSLLGCGFNPDRRKKSFTYCHAQAAAFAGVTEAILTPCERMQTLLQSNKYHGQFGNTIEAIKVVSTYGFREFYRGFVLITLRNASSNILFFSLRDPFKYLIINSFPKNQKYFPYENFVADFVSGALLGATLSTVYFPVNVVKTKMQADMGTKFDNFFNVLRIVWKERDRSLRGLFRGAQLNFARSLLSWGITNSTFEYLKKCFI